jgi:signal transduction histidine kinase
LNALIDVVRARSVDPSTADNAYLLVDAALRPLAGNLAQWPLPTTRRAGPLQFEIEGQEEGGRFFRLYRARTVALPGSGHLLVAHNVHRRAGIQLLISKALGWGMAFTLVLGVAGGVLSGRALLGRLRRIADTSTRIMDGNLADRIPVSGASDELDRLAMQLNRMLERIERLVEGMRTVSDNVAHDLRAPLTRLRGSIELALIEDPDLGRYRAALEEALAETDRVLRVFNAVMGVAQARSGALRGQMELLDLNQVVAEAVELYEPAIEARGLVLELASAPDPVPILGHRQLIAQVFVNLLDNAVKFTPPGGALRVGIARRGGEAVAFVADTGPGIPPQLREQVLAPFVRGNDCEGVPGTGLGLSLVAAVAHLHRATLSLEDNRPGLRVTLSMPLAG